MLKVAEHSPNNFQFSLVGTGSLEKEIKKKIEESKYKNCFNLISRLENKLVFKLLHETDIYVSLNKYGNLSNANLEAISAGCCIILPCSQQDHGIDLATDQLLNSETVWRLNDPEDAQELANVVLELASSEKRRLKMSNRTLKLSENLPSWHDRTEYEFNKLKQIVNNSR